MDDVNMLVLVKDEEQYVFVFADAYRQDCESIFIKYAVNPKLGFTWTDAATLVERLKELPYGEDADDGEPDDDGQDYWRNR